MSKLQSVADYEREIAELDRLIQLEESLAQEHGMDFATELSIQSFRTRRAALEQEMRELGDERMPQHEIAVTFEGRPIHNHTVEAAFLSTMLRDLQRVVESVVASAAGSTGRTGPLAQAVRQRSTLRFAGSFAGSFGMRLETAAQELELDDAGSVAHTVDTLVRLLESGDDSPRLLEAIAPLTARARANYMSLLDHLRESGAEMRVEWRSTKGPRQARLTATKAERALDKLRRVDEKEYLQSHRGVLDGAIKSRGIFEFRTDDGEVLAGGVAESVIPRLREFFDQPCIALITTREVTDRTTGDTRVYHRLEDLQHIAQDLFSEA